MAELVSILIHTLLREILCELPIAPPALGELSSPGKLSSAAPR